MIGSPLGTRLSRGRREAAQVAVGATPVGLDVEAARLDRTLGVAVGMASAAHARPGRLRPILEVGLPRLGRAHAPQHPHPPPPTAHPPAPPPPPPALPPPPHN